MLLWCFDSMCFQSKKFKKSCFLQIWVWPGWLITYRGAWIAKKWSPLPVLTGTNGEQSC